MVITGTKGETLIDYGLELVNQFRAMRRREIERIDAEIYNLVNARYKLPRNVWFFVENLTGNFDGIIYYEKNIM